MSVTLETPEATMTRTEARRKFGHVTLVLSDELRAKVSKAADSRGLTRSRLLEKMIATVFNDDLLKAILDDED
jgi:hypothetical protein